MHLIQFLIACLGAVCFLASAFTVGFIGSTGEGKPRYRRADLLALGLFLVTLAWILQLTWNGGGTVIGG